jgi:protein-arginine kinase activator protein McsA
MKPASNSAAQDVLRLLAAMRTKSAQSDVCPLCGWSVRRVVETGLLGCGLCYSSLAWPGKAKPKQE